MICCVSRKWGIQFKVFYKLLVAMLYSLICLFYIQLILVLNFLHLFQSSLLSVQDLQSLFLPSKYLRLKSWILKHVA